MRRWLRYMYITHEYHFCCVQVASQLQLSAARSQTQFAHILVLAFDQPKACYLKPGFNKTHVLDFFSDPFGWIG